MTNTWSNKSLQPLCVLLRNKRSKSLGFNQAIAESGGGVFPLRVK